MRRVAEKLMRRRILQPINNVLKEISVPSIKLDYTVYIDEIDTRFKSGAAKDEQIHELNKIQANLLDRVENEVGKQLMDEASEFTGILKRQLFRLLTRLNMALPAKSRNWKRRYRTKSAILRNIIFSEICCRI